MLTINEVWNQIERYIEFLRPYVIIAGAFLTFCGRMMSKASLVVACYFTSLAIACLIYSLDPVEYDYFTTPGLNTNPTDYMYGDAIKFRDHFLWGSSFGIFTGYIVTSISSLEKIAHVNLAAWGGLLTSLIVNKTFLYLAG